MNICENRMHHFDIMLSIEDMSNDSLSYGAEISLPSIENFQNIQGRDFLYIICILLSEDTSFR